MELLLWLWFYDPRWFFNFKISVDCYKNAWLIPLFLHLFLMFVCLYYLQISETFSCDRSLKLWLYSRTFFSFLLSVTIVFFQVKISKVNRKEKSYGVLYISIEFNFNLNELGIPYTILSRP